MTKIYFIPCGSPGRVDLYGHLLIHESIDFSPTPTPSHPPPLPVAVCVYSFTLLYPYICVFNRGPG